MYLICLGIENGQWKWQCPECKEAVLDPKGDVMAALRKHIEDKHPEMKGENHASGLVQTEGTSAP